MRQDKITSYQYATLTFFLLNSFCMNIGYHTLTNANGNDAIFNILIGGIFILLFGSFIFYFHRKHPDGIIDTIKKRYPICIQLIFYFFFLILIGISSIYSFSILISFIHYYILKEVSLLTIAVTLMFTILYIVKKGIKTISKMSEIFFYIYILIFLFGTIGLIKYMDLSNLKPLFTTSIKENTLSSLTYFLSSVIPLFLLLVIPKKEMDIQKKGRKIPYFFILLSILLIFIQFIIILSVLGIQLTNIYQNPDMIVYKKISFLNLLERVEVFLALNNILNSLFMIILGIYFMKQILNQYLRKKKEHILLALIGIIIIILTNIITFPLSLYIQTNIVMLILLGIFFLSCLVYKHNRS